MAKVSQKVVLQLDESSGPVSPPHQFERRVRVSLEGGEGLLTMHEERDFSREKPGLRRWEERVMTDDEVVRVEEVIEALQELEIEKKPERRVGVGVNRVRLLIDRKAVKTVDFSPSDLRRASDGLRPIIALLRALGGLGR